MLSTSGEGNSRDKTRELTMNNVSLIISINVLWSLFLLVRLDLGQEFISITLWLN